MSETTIGYTLLVDVSRARTNIGQLVTELHNADKGFEKVGKGSSVFTEELEETAERARVLKRILGPMGDKLARFSVELELGVEKTEEQVKEYRKLSEVFARGQVQIGDLTHRTKQLAAWYERAAYHAQEQATETATLNNRMSKLAMVIKMVAFEAGGAAGALEEEALALDRVGRMSLRVEAAVKGVASTFSLMKEKMGDLGSRAQSATKKMHRFGRRLSLNTILAREFAQTMFGAARAVGNFVIEGAQLRSLDASFEKLASESGPALEEMQAALNSMVSDSTIKRMTVLGRQLGVTGKDIPKLARIAKAAAQNTGEDIEKMFEDIIKGTARRERRVLDNLGIKVENLSKLWRDLAKEKGKAVADLSQEEKDEAFVAHLIESADIITRIAGEDATTSYKQASANLENLFDQAKKFVDEVVQGSGVVENFQKVLDLTESAFREMSDTIAVFVETGGESFISSLKLVLATLRALQPLLALVNVTLQAMTIIADGVTAGLNLVGDAFEEMMDYLPDLGLFTKELEFQEVWTKRLTQAQRAYNASLVETITKTKLLAKINRESNEQQRTFAANKRAEELEKDTKPLDQKLKEIEELEREIAAKNKAADSDSDMDVIAALEVELQARRQDVFRAANRSVGADFYQMFGDTVAKEIRTSRGEGGFIQDDEARKNIMVGAYIAAAQTALDSKDHAEVANKALEMLERDTAVLIDRSKKLMPDLHTLVTAEDLWAEDEMRRDMGKETLSQMKAFTDTKESIAEGILEWQDASDAVYQETEESIEREKRDHKALVELMSIGAGTGAAQAGPPVYVQQLMDEGTALADASYAWTGPLEGTLMSKIFKDQIINDIAAQQRRLNDAFRSGKLGVELYRKEMNKLNDAYENREDKIEQDHLKGFEGDLIGGVLFQGSMSAEGIHERHSREKAELESVAAQVSNVWNTFAVKGIETGTFQISQAGLAAFGELVAEAKFSAEEIQNSFADAAGNVTTMLGDALASYVSIGGGVAGMMFGGVLGGLFSALGGFVTKLIRRDEKNNKKRDDQIKKLAEKKRDIQVTMTLVNNGLAVDDYTARMVNLAMKRSIQLGDRQ